MSSPTPARVAALDVLRAVGRGQRLDLAFGHAVNRLPRQERAWVHESVYGVMRLRSRLDFLVSQHLHRPFESLDRAVQDLLRLGAYQCVYMGSVPAYAAVSQSVEAAKSQGLGRSGSLINAVLRGVAGAGEGPCSRLDFEGDPRSWLTHWGSHPEWLIDRWLDRWEPKEVRRLVEANNRRAELFLTPIKGDPAEVVGILRQAGIEAQEVGKGTGSVLLPSGTDPAKVLSMVPGSVVQDPAASMVAPFVGKIDGIVVDLCAAPGGKALGLTREARYVVALDRSWPRLRIMTQNVGRVDSPIGVVQAKAESPPFRAVDCVLVDAPCSGTGTLRRHPDSRWRLEAEDIGRMAAVQARILDGAAKVVSSGGCLVYSTCTLEPEENEIQVDQFLKRHRDFRLESPTQMPSWSVDSRGYLVVLPQSSGFDGAFAAKLRRVA